ncbi:hypothetical protein FH603_1410 [Spirosoma sp. LMG 31447]|uniref:Uncharacterized protein n=1 Tax=Spirosoma utsteinense TaxID=2585773 RepID=A0ABR6W2T5_9BACT|nr:hypothetical protein [Spirosoma utsteinense]
MGIAKLIESCNFMHTVNLTSYDNDIIKIKSNSKAHVDARQGI